MGLASEEVEHDLVVGVVPQLQPVRRRQPAQEWEERRAELTRDWL